MRPKVTYLEVRQALKKLDEVAERRKGGPDSAIFFYWYGSAPSWQDRSAEWCSWGFTDANVDEWTSPETRGIWLIEGKRWDPNWPPPSPPA